MRPPAVLIVDPGCFTPGYDRSLASSLSRIGYDVELITSEHEFERQEPLPGVTTRLLFPGSQRHGHWPGSRLARGMLRAAGYPVGLLRLDAALRRRPPGILHVQWAHLPWLDALLWRRWRRRGWRVVYTAHDVRPLPGTTPSILSDGYDRLTTNADAVVVHYEAARAELLALGIGAGRVRVIAPAPPVPAGPTPDRARAKSALGIDPLDPVVLFFGFLKPYKGLDVLLASLPAVRAALPRVRLVVAGEVFGSRPRYERLARRLGVHDAIHWRPRFVRGPDVAGLFGAADVVALPYVAASSSGVLLTAYAFGRPVVASRIGGLADLVEDGSTGALVPPGDPPALAAAILEILADRPRAEEMGESGRRLLERRHTWAAHAEGLGELFRGLAA